MTAGQPRVVVVGGVNVDIVASASGALLPHVSNPGRIRISPGGAGRNVAENLARLGARVTLLAAVGADPLSELAIAQAAAAGVDTSRIVRIPGGGNYYTAIERSGTLEWAVSDMTAAESLLPARVEAQRAVLQSADAVVVDANLRPDAIAAAGAAAGGALLALLPVSPAKAPRTRAVLPRASLIVLSTHEAEVLTGRRIDTPDDAIQAAGRMRPSSSATVVITMGGRGLGWIGTESVWIDQVPVPVVDPSGAGDAVAAVAVIALLGGWGPQRSAQLAMAAATLTISINGATHPGLSLEALHARV